MGHDGSELQPLQYETSRITKRSTAILSEAQSSNVLAPLPSIETYHHYLKKYLSIGNNVKAAEGETGMR